MENTPYNTDTFRSFLCKYGLEIKQNKIKRSASFWNFFKEVNKKGIKKCEFIKDEIRLIINEENLHWFLRYSFVIPNVSSWQCRRCGQCCQCLNDNTKSDPHLCEYLVIPNICKIYENRPVACKMFPFHLINIPRFGDLLMIADMCEGVNRGKKISLNKYDECVRTLNKYDLQVKRCTHMPITISSIYLSGEKKWVFATAENWKKYKNTKILKGKELLEKSNEVTIT